jgi:hypothetical protein
LFVCAEGLSQSVARGKGLFTEGFAFSKRGTSVASWRKAWRGAGLRDYGLQDHRTEICLCDEGPGQGVARGKGLFTEGFAFSKRGTSVAKRGKTWQGVAPGDVE